MPPIDAAHLRALIVAYRKADDRRTTLAVSTEPEWAGPELLHGPGPPARVVACRSPLAVREALVNHGDRTDELLVLLTPCSGSELGLDVRARLVKGDVLPLDPFASVLGLFGATVLDPLLVVQRWLIEDLIALAPPGGWADRKPLGGVIDVDLAWRTWHEARLGLVDPPSTVADVLALGRRPGLGVALSGLPAEQRERVSERWSGGAAGPIPVLVDLLAAGRGGDLVALGLVADVLWAVTDDATMATHQHVGRARLEEEFGRDRLDRRAAEKWADDSVAAVEADPNAPAVLDAAQQILASADASSLAVLSDTLPLGFDQRLAALGLALAAGDLARSEEALALVRRHRHTARRAHRLAMAEAAVRLLRRSQLDPPVAPTSFPAAAAAYAAQGAWVEEARRLLTEGDHVPEAADAYTALADAATAEQLRVSRHFAKLLGEWSASEPICDGRIVPLERVLGEIVAPIARVAPVLVVVCDGMSLAVGHALMRDVVHEGWAAAAPDHSDGWPVGVAALPTVTEVSRTTLLAGRRAVGGQAEERDGFGSHPALRAASSPAHPPVLIHKAGLVAPSGVALPDPVRQMVADPDQRVVGVVVNSVDDHLARGDQVRVGWDLVSLRPLPWLLDAAAEAGRVVVITADHGHVLQGPASVARSRPGGGERWRIPPPPPEEDEVEIAGPRVLLGGGRVVLPADDTLRYGGYKHGYHGGATPEEVLVPVEVLARRLPEGWSHRPVAAPPWWSEELAPEFSPRPTPPPPAPPQARPPASPTLFDEPTPSRATKSGGWVDALLAAPGFVAHRQRARLPRPLSDDRLRGYLEAIDANGGTIPLTALAGRTGEPRDTLRMALTLVQRLLNLDGAAVLTVRADETVVLNRELAELQFEIGGR